MTHNLTHTGKCAERFQEHRAGSLAFLPGVFLTFECPLHHLRHEVPHGFRRLVLHLAGGVGVGAQGEPRVVVAQHTGDRFDVHAVLQGQGGEGVSEIVKADVFQSGVFEDLLVELYHGVRVVHFPGSGRGEYIRTLRMLLALLDGLLGDRYPSHRGFGFGPGEGQLAAGVLDVLFAHRDCPVLDVQVIPEEGHQLAFPQAAHQLQVEHGKDSSGISGLQIRLQVFGPEGFHLHLLYLGGNAVIGGVARDQPLLHRPLKGAVEHQVDAAHGGAA